MTEKAKYLVLRLSYIDRQLHEEGAEIEYDGVPGSALKPLNEAAEAAKAKVTGGKKAVIEVVVPAVDVTDGVPGSEDVVKLREEYELLFNEKPHHNTSAKTLSEKIAEERQRLGV